MRLPGGGTFAKSGQEYIIPCPKCGKKFSWSLTKSKGHCFSCKFACRSVSEFREHFPLDDRDVYLSDQSDVSPTSVYGRVLEDADALVPAYQRYDAAVYLTSRGVTKEIAERVGILATQDRIHVPCRSPLPHRHPIFMSRSIVPGQKGWMTARGVDKSNYWFDGNHAIELTADGEKPLILVEGIFDVLTPGLLGRAVAVLGSKLSVGMESWLARMHGRGCGRVLIWFDPDDAGELGAKAIMAKLRTYGCNVERVGGWSHENLRRFVSAPEPGSCTPAQAREILRGHSCFV